MNKNDTWDVSYVVNEEDKLTDKAFAHKKEKEAFTKFIKTKLRNRRKQRGITQNELARSTGISESKIKKYESLNDPTLVPILDLIKIANYYNFSIDYFCWNKRKKSGIEDAIDYTGLTEKAITNIRNLNNTKVLDDKQILNMILSSEVLNKIVPLLAAIAILRNKCANDINLLHQSQPIRDESGFINISGIEDYNMVFGSRSEGHSDAYYYHATQSNDIKAEILNIISSAIDELSYKSLNSK